MDVSVVLLVRGFGVIMVLVMIIVFDASPFLHISLDMILQSTSCRHVVHLQDGSRHCILLRDLQSLQYKHMYRTYSIIHTYTIPLIRTLPSNSNGIHRRHTTLHMALQNSKFQFLIKLITPYMESSSPKPHNYTNIHK